MRSFLTWGIGIALIATMVFGGNATAGKIRLDSKYELSDPHVYKNLSVFFIHGKTDIKGKRLVPLAEAIERGMVTIDETGNVNSLTATNHSDTHYVFIQSGDMVKGGRQDRTLSQDILLPPKSKKSGLNSFCVEQGRWHKRGKENASKFSSSNKRLSSKELKLAAKKAKSQRAVWKAVKDEQERLSRKVGKSVRKSSSATSLQLSLEDEDVVRQCMAYQKALLPIGQREIDAVGFAFAVNGQFTTADIYGDPDLFQKLWPKLIETAAYEALASYDKNQAGASTNTDAVKSHLLDALGSRMKKDNSSKSTRRATGETRRNYAFETQDDKGQTIHINIIKK